MTLSDEIHGMREGVIDLFVDLCQLGRSANADTGPEPSVPVIYDTESIPCGVSVSAGGEASDGSQAPVNQIVIRLPLTIDLSDLSRIRVLTRVWEDLSAPEDYAILGVPVRGFTCYMARCDRVTGGSVK